ncbi:antA/AntB antirepressor family protein [Sporanaerobacter sp. PP17-6a]|uniref:antA/AntB antirepressor family protein n=1 Tax=Sporanaerobacter sp. PP17-6a TaxID=1891289 RepID=UPI0008A01D70|nr:antA/AntB antirepressor family protein [Sporanaerobacter sp. PP17-6a]SCL87915.1 Phage anti-repressor protein [Sporanaerobacter sp. PP17-6a]
MNDLIKVEVNNKGQQVVSARNLYEKLGISKRFSVWWINQVERLGLKENLTYCTSRYTNSNNQEFIDYIVPIDIAKHLCMVSGGEKAWRIRDYFIEVENQWNSPEQVMARALQIANVKMLDYQNKVIELSGKIEILTHSNKLYTTTEIAKELGYRSATVFNKELEKRKIQYKINRTWVLTADYSEKGYVSIKQNVLENGKVVYDRKWTETGRQFLLEIFGKEKIA